MFVKQISNRNIYKDETRNADEAIVDLYSKLRQDDKVPANATENLLDYAYLKQKIRLS